MNINYEDALARSTDEPAFSNGTEWDCWSSEWCERCVHEPDCPLITIAFCEDRTPAEWVEQGHDEKGLRGLHDPYGCLEFKPKETAS